MSDEDVHHLAKNTLQNIISYINVMFARKEVVQKSEINKLLKFVRNLAALHDFLREASRNKEDTSLVSLDTLLYNLFDMHAGEQPIKVDLLPSLFCTTRRAVTVSLIVIELLDNALRHGGDKTFVHCELDEADKKAKLIIRNELRDDNPVEAPKPSDSFGLQLVEKLMQVDFSAKPIIKKEAGFYTVEVDIPVN